MAGDWWQSPAIRLNSRPHPYRFTGGMSDSPGAGDKFRNTSKTTPALQGYRRKEAARFTNAQTLTTKLTCGVALR